MEKIFLSGEESLGSDDLKRLRRHAKKVFEKLERKVQNDHNDEKSVPPRSWVGDEENNKPSCRSLQKRYFDQHGFLVIRNFCGTQEVINLKQAMADSVRDHWFPEGLCDDDDGEDNNNGTNKGKQQKVTSFGTDAKSNEARGDPFLESADKVSYFAEPTALDAESGSLKQEFRHQNKKLLALCKAGHGLHLPHMFRNSPPSGVESDDTENGTNNEESNVHQPFFEYTSSSKMRDLVLSLGYQDPVVPQSMYIFKNPKVGGVVGSHQDSTFLFTTPKQTCLGLWLALDDATLQNGCLWIRPGSHREPLRRQFLRNPKHDGTADNDEPKLTFSIHHENPGVTWEGSVPESVEVWKDNEEDDAHRCNPSEDPAHDDDDPEPEISSMNFVPVEVEAGDLVLFCGTLDHFSLPNFSEEQRHTFQLHLVEGPNAGIEWSPSNWLQYESEESERNEFLRLLDYVDGT